MFRARWPRTLLVAGNHEYYSRRGFRLEYVARVLRQLAAEVGVTFLDRDRVEIDGVVFLGCTLWSKTSYRDFAAMNDSRLVFASHQENLDCHARDVWWLEEQLESLPPDQRVVVLTHHVPTKALAPAECGSAYASDLEHLVARTNLWLCGHVHEPAELQVGKALLVRSPVGGPRERIRPLDKFFVV
jgi:Icc-related predicted phosphoesterase